jgi:hypothetical protein
MKASSLYRVDAQTSSDFVASQELIRVHNPGMPSAVCGI